MCAISACTTCRVQKAMSAPASHRTLETKKTKQSNFMLCNREYNRYRCVMFETRANSTAG